MTYIDIGDYFGKWIKHPDVTDEVTISAIKLLDKVNAILEEAFTDGIDFDINPATNSYVAGQTYGGFRPQDCPQGSPGSSHKTGAGIDIHDGSVSGGGQLGEWLFKHQNRLMHHGLYMEHPTATVGKNTRWVHLTTRAPRSGRRVFMP